MLRRRPVPWTDLQTCSTWGEAAGKRREDLGHHPPHPPHARDDRLTTRTLSRSTHCCPTNGHDRGQDPLQGQSSSHSRGTTTPGPSGWQRNRTLGTRKDSTQNPHSSVQARKGEEQQVHFNRECNPSRGVIRCKHPPGRTSLTQVSMRRSGGGARAVNETLQGISSGSGR